MDNNFINQTIEDLRSCTDTSLRNVQRAYAPAYYTMRTEVRFHLDNDFILYSEDPNNLLLLSPDIPFSVNQTKFSYRDSLANLIALGSVNPFLLFLDGRFIPWERIDIIKTTKYDYILVKDYQIQFPEVVCISLPLDISYQQNSPVIDPKAIMSFNKFGEIVTKPNVLQPNDYPYVNIIIDNPNVLTEKALMTQTKQEMQIAKGRKISNDNILVFKNGLLVNSPISVLGFNIFSVQGIIVPCQDKLEYRVFYNTTNPAESKDNIYTIPELPGNLGRDYAKDMIANSQTIPKYLQSMNIPYDFYFRRDLSYEENINNIVNYTMAYRADILSPAFLKKSRCSSLYYTGADLNARKDINGYVEISLKVKDSFNNMVIILVNGLLYEFYHTGFIDAGKFKVMWSGVQATDVVEVMYFKDVNNTTFNMTFYSDSDNIETLSQDIDIDRLKVFSALQDPTEIVYPAFGQSALPIEIEMNKEFKGLKDGLNTYHMYPINTFYYDMQYPPTVVAFENQFRYKYKRIVKGDLVPGSTECIRINLDGEFDYCNNEKQFLVYANGRRLSDSQFDIALPNTGDPINERAAYISYVAPEGSFIEIFYVPVELEEIANLEQANLNGDIIVDKSKLGFSLDNDLYFFYINGRKLRSSELTNISNNHVRINTNIPNISDVSIVRHIPAIDILDTLFAKNDDLLTKIIATIPADTLDILYGKVLQSNTEPNINTNITSDKSLMYAVLKDYWLKPYSVNADTFIMDNSIDNCFTETDAAGNIVIDAFNANTEDKINGV